MPRKSAAELAVADPPKLQNLPQPPSDLTDFQTALWHEIIATKPADWWDNANLPLLRAMVVHESAARVIDQALDAFPVAELYTDEGLARYEKLGKLRSVHTGKIESLATKMRLTQQSKYGARGAEGAARAATKGSGRTWQPAK